MSRVIIGDVKSRRLTRAGAVPLSLGVLFSGVLAFGVWQTAMALAYAFGWPAVVLTSMAVAAAVGSLVVLLKRTARR